MGPVFLTAFVFGWVDSSDLHNLTFFEEKKALSPRLPSRGVRPLPRGGEPTGGTT
jgi:hypothetical protein